MIANSNIRAQVTNIAGFRNMGGSIDKGDAHIRSASTFIVGTKTGRATVDIGCRASGFQQFSQAYIALAGGGTHVMRPQVVLNVSLSGARLDTGETPRLRGSTTTPNIDTETGIQTPGTPVPYDIAPIPVAGFLLQYDTKAPEPGSNLFNDGTGIGWDVEPATIADAHRLRIISKIQHVRIQLSLNLQEPVVAGFIKGCQAFGDKLVQDETDRQKAALEKQKAAEAEKAKADARALELGFKLAAGRVLLSEAESNARLISKVAPIYPPIALVSHMSGSVPVHLIISTSGTVKEVLQVGGNGMFKQAATAAVMQWRYEPLLVEGTRYEIDTTTTLTFQLTH